MRIDYIPSKNKFKKLNVLPEINPVEENLNNISKIIYASGGSAFVKGGVIQSPNFVKKKKGWMLDGAGTIWAQESYIGDENSYLSFDKSNGLEIKGKMMISNPGDISGSDISNDENWTDDTTADAAQTTADVKSKVFRQTSQPNSGMSTGDYWIDTDDGDRPYTYSGSSWVECLTVIDGGKITTGTIDAGVVTVSNLNASDINTGTLTVASGSHIAEIVIEGEGYLTFKNAAGTSKGEAYADNSNFYLTSLAAEVKTQIIGHDGVQIATGDSAANTFRVNTTVSGTIIVNGTDYSGNIGTSDNYFASMYATTYHFKKSGGSAKYIQINSNSGIDVNTDFFVGGALSKASGSFKIDHPLKPKTYWLEHSFVESPDMLNLYTGNAIIKKGICKIKMPKWFIALNGKNQDEFTYQLTSIDQLNILWVKQEMNNKGEVIFTGEKDGKFSYMITAIRHDKWAEKHRVKVESKKLIK